MPTHTRTCPMSGLHWTVQEKRSSPMSNSARLHPAELPRPCHPPLAGTSSLVVSSRQRGSNSSTGMTLPWGLPEAIASRLVQPHHALRPGHAPRPGSLLALVRLCCAMAGNDLQPTRWERWLGGCEQGVAPLLVAWGKRRRSLGLVQFLDLALLTGSLKFFFVCLRNQQETVQLLKTRLDCWRKTG